MAHPIFLQKTYGSISGCAGPRAKGLHDEGLHVLKERSLADNKYSSCSIFKVHHLLQLASSSDYSYIRMQHKSSFFRKFFFVLAFHQVLASYLLFLSTGENQPSASCLADWPIQEHSIGITNKLATVRRCLT